MGSSGVNVYDRVEIRDCDVEGCEFDGQTDVSIDPESHSTFWECPNGHQHESTTWDDYQEDEDA